MEEDKFDLKKGKQLRDEGIEEVSFDREDWIQRARLLAVNIARKDGTVDSDRVVKLYPIPEDADPRIMGAVFNSRVADFPFVPCGWTQTARKQGHARPMRVWKLKED
jgi:hypothetical protein